MTTQKAIPAWAKAKFEQIQNKANKKVLPLFTFPEGITEIEIIPDSQTRDKNFGTDQEPQIKTIYQVKIAGKVREIAPNKTFEAAFIDLVCAGVSKIAVCRTGKELTNTNYQLKKAD